MLVEAPALSFRHSIDSGSSVYIMAQKLGTQDHPIATLDVTGVYSPAIKEQWSNIGRLL